MERIEKAATEFTPKIVLDDAQNYIEFSGKSYPENTFEFYSPITAWLKEYFDEKRECNIHLDLEYINSSSLKSFFDIFDIFEASHEDNGSVVNIKWHYDEDNDISLETGEDFKDDFSNLNIELVQK